MQVSNTTWQFGAPGSSPTPTTVQFGRFALIVSAGLAVVQAALPVPAGGALQWALLAAALLATALVALRRNH